MRKRTAIVTGATGGLGKEFIRLMLKEDIDEIWAVARNKEKLESLREGSEDRIAVFSRDLSNAEELHSFESILREKNPEIVYLINNAGIGKMGAYDDFTVNDIEKTLDINCRAVAVLCRMCIPYMNRKSHMLNISSQASFQPDPYLNMYAATKAFVTSYSRALNREVQAKGITVTAVCPGWVDTELLLKEMNHQKIKFPGLVTADMVAEKAIRDAKAGKDMSVCTVYVKFMQLFSKILPHKVIMDLWIKSIKKYS